MRRHDATSVENTSLAGRVTSADSPSVKTTVKRPERRPYAIDVVREERGEMRIE